MPEANAPVELALHCVNCGKRATLRFSDWHPDGKLTPANWECPHCHRQQSGLLPGHLQSVTLG